MAFVTNIPLGSRRASHGMVRTFGWRTISESAGASPEKNAG